MIWLRNGMILLYQQTGMPCRLCYIYITLCPVPELDIAKAMTKHIYAKNPEARTATGTNSFNMYQYQCHGCDHSQSQNDSSGFRGLFQRRDHSFHGHSRECHRFDKSPTKLCPNSSSGSNNSRQRPLLYMLPIWLLFGEYPECDSTTTGPFEEFISFTLPDESTSDSISMAYTNITDEVESQNLTKYLNI